MAFEADRYAVNIVARYEHWTTFLHPSQAYLGRSYIALNRPSDDIDIYGDTTPAEKYELDVAVNGIHVALAKLYQPDRFNHGDFRNVWPHCHLHVIPRYQSARTLNGQEFTDPNWGGNYAPYDKAFVATPQTFDIIKESIKTELRTF